MSVCETVSLCLYVYVCVCMCECVCECTPCVCAENQPLAPRRHPSHLLGLEECGGGRRVRRQGRDTVLREPLPVRSSQALQW